MDASAKKPKASANPYSDTSNTVFEGVRACRIQFHVGHEPGQLRAALGIVEGESLNMSHIESQPTPILGEYKIFVDIDMDNNTLERAQRALAKLNQRESCRAVLVHTEQTQTPWFPRRMADLDTFASKVLSYGSELEADHPGFKDAVYRARRAEITTLARQFKTGMALPHIEYTPEEIATWNVVYTKLKELYPKYACKQHRFVFPLLEAKCGYGPNSIPQLEQVSQFLQSATGWRLRPVMGLLSPRDFLNGLAFRVFHSTQYIRHHSQPLYTPEPDVCHELLGHVPLFADPAFAVFSQEIGLQSLGASDAEIERLSTVYWFTVEFGLCREDGEIRAFGAGLLSSFGELEYSVTSTKSERVPFDPWVAASTKYPITSYQPKYFVANSFQEATELVQRFAASFSRGNVIRYDPYTSTMTVLDSLESAKEVASGLSRDATLLTAALTKLTTPQ